MPLTDLTFSDDQAEAHDRVADLLRAAGVDLDDNLLTPMSDGKSQVFAVTGKAGSRPAAAGHPGPDQQGRQRVAQPGRASDDDSPHPLYPGL